MKQDSFTIFIIDVDALICCSQHLHSHGCRLETAKEYLERVAQKEGRGQKRKLLDLIINSLVTVYLIAQHDKHKRTIIVVVNGRPCPENIIGMFESLLSYLYATAFNVDFFLEVSEILRLLKNAEVCPSDTCRSTECKLLCWEKLGTCLGKTAKEDCKTIEARISCILDLVCGGGLHHSIPCSINGIVAVFCYSGSLNVDVSCERLIRHWENFPCNINGNADVHHIVMVY